MNARAIPDALQHARQRYRTVLVDPDGGVFTYALDALDRVVSLADASGNVFTQQYDADSRPTTLQKLVTLV